MAAVFSQFQYLKKKERWLREKPYFVNVPLSALKPGSQVTNEESDSVQEIKICNMRGRLNDISLDKNGFALFEHDFSASEDAEFLEGRFRDSKHTEVVTDWLVWTLGAERAHFISGTIRKRDASFPARTWGSSGYQQPIEGVHVDYTPWHARHRVEKMFSKEEANITLSKRYQFVNFWRPLLGPVRDWPLGVLDFQTVKHDEDLIAADVIYPNDIVETYNVFYNKSHQWYYVSDQLPTEALVFKSFDSKPGVAPVCPHAAFDLKMSGEAFRQSVDMVFLVVYSS